MCQFLNKCKWNLLPRCPSWVLGCVNGECCGKFPGKDGKETFARLNKGVTKVTSPAGSWDKAALIIT